MANVKISELTALTPPDAADLVPVTDSSASQTKRTTVGEIVGIIDGDVDVATDGTATISELPVSKLQNGAARQLLQTDAAGTGVEWTSNIDVPGTLDVTGATTLDSTLGVTGQSTLASAAVSDLTSGRVVLAGTSGELEDNAGLTFNGTRLDVDGDVAVAGTLTFEGSTADDFETTLAVTDPTADRTITLPDVSGTVVTTGDTGSVTSTMIENATIVDADVSPTAEIAVSKLANGTASQVLVTDGTDVSWSDDLTLAGNLTVNGTTTTVNTETLVVEDKNIELGVVASPTDVTADGGGITLKGSTDKTINWVNATDAWTFSEHVDIASAKEYRIAGTKVLDATSLGSAVVNSSLTSVGTIGTGAWEATAIGVDYGGTGQTTYTDGQLLIGNSTGNTLAKATLTAGTGIAVTNGPGTITLAIDSDTAIADITTTATTGTLPTVDGSVIIADAAAPTVDELLEYCVELEAKLEAALAALRTVGVIAT